MEKNNVPEITGADLLNIPGLKTYLGSNKFFVFAFKSKNILKMENVFRYQDKDYIIKEIHERNGIPDNWFMVYCRAHKLEN